METWKTILTHPNYEISNLGRVKNTKTNEFKQVKPDKNGYIKVTLYPGNKVFMVHRLVAEYFLSNPNNKPCVNHIDCIRHNNFVTNLEWVTYVENAKHTIKSGNNPDFNGANNPRAKFTEQDILDIRADDSSVACLSKKYNVSETAITNIKNGTRYKNVGGFIRDKYYKGNQVRGTRVTKSTLTEEQVYLIKYKTTNLSTKEVADTFKVTINVIQKIRSNITWKHI